VKKTRQAVADFLRLAKAFATPAPAPRRPKLQSVENRRRPRRFSTFCAPTPQFVENLQAGAGFSTF
jgi:hypothetical protein